MSSLSTQSGRRNFSVLRRTRLAVLPQLPMWGLWVAVLSVAVLALGFFAVATPKFTAEEFLVDQDLSRHHSGFLTSLAMLLNTVFSPAGGLAMITAVCLFLLVARKSPVNAVAFGGIAAAGWLSSQFFKVVVERQRPSPALLFDPLAPETGSNSFPSGHVALAVGLSWAFCFLLRGTRWSRVRAILGILIPVIVAWSRLYVGVHYPSDVVASFLAASAAVVFFSAVWNRYQGGLLPRVPFLARFGPVAAAVPSTAEPAPSAPRVYSVDGSTVNSGHSATSNHSNP